MTGSQDLVRRLLNDIGGCRPGPYSASTMNWSRGKRCHVLADVLNFHKIINTEEMGCGVEALGAEMVGKLSYYERWIVAFANTLFRKGVLTPSELALKMKDVGRKRTTSPDAVALRVVAKPLRVPDANAKLPGQRHRPPVRQRAGCGRPIDQHDAVIGSGMGEGNRSVDRRHGTGAGEVEDVTAGPVADQHGPPRRAGSPFPFAARSMLARRPGRGRQQEIATLPGRPADKTLRVHVGAGEQADAADAGDVGYRRPIAGGRPGFGANPQHGDLSMGP